MGTFTPVSGYNTVRYASANVTGHDVQRCSLFRPDETRWIKPPRGWPTIVAPNLAGFRSTYLYAQLDAAKADSNWFEELLLRALDSGYQVLSAAILPTYSDEAGTSCPPTVDSNPVNLTLGSQAYGNAPYRNGCFIPFEVPTPSNYSGHGAYWHLQADPAADNSYRDSAMLTQFAKFNASAMQINTEQMIAMGGSACADTMAYHAFAADRSAQFFPNAVAGTQDAVNTRAYKAAIFFAWQPWIPLFSAPCPIVFIPKTIAAGGDTLYSAASLDVSESDATHKARSSFLYYATRPDILASNRQIKLFTTFSDSDVAGTPFTTAKTDATTNPHSSWGGSAIINSTAFPDATFYMVSTDANTQNDGIINTVMGGNFYQYNGILTKTLFAYLDSEVGVTRIERRGRRSLRR